MISDGLMWIFWLETEFYFIFFIFLHQLSPLIFESQYLESKLIVFFLSNKNKRQKIFFNYDYKILIVTFKLINMTRNPLSLFQFFHLYICFSLFFPLSFTPFFHPFIFYNFCLLLVSHCFYFPLFFLFCFIFPFLFLFSFLFFLSKPIMIFFVPKMPTFTFYPFFLSLVFCFIFSSKKISVSAKIWTCCELHLLVKHGRKKEKYQLTNISDWIIFYFSSVQKYQSRENIQLTQWLTENGWSWSQRRLYLWFSYSQPLNEVKFHNLKRLTQIHLDLIS